MSETLYEQMRIAVIAMRDMPRPATLQFEVGPGQLRPFADAIGAAESDKLPAFGGFPVVVNDLLPPGFVALRLNGVVTQFTRFADAET